MFQPDISNHVTASIVPRAAALGIQRCGVSVFWAADDKGAFFWALNVVPAIFLKHGLLEI